MLNVRAHTPDGNQCVVAPRLERLDFGKPIFPTQLPRALIGAFSLRMRFVGNSERL